MTSHEASGSERGEGRNAVILFVDICGSMPLYERSGDRDALAMIAAALDEMELLVHRHGGSVVRSKGDDLLCTFHTPMDALDAAADILSTVMDVKTPVRMGVHYGPIIEARSDIFGDAVNVAARMLGLAKAGEMLCTEAVVALLPEAWRSRVTPLGSRSVKGKDEPIAIYSMVQDDGESTLLVHPDTVTERAMQIQAETQVVLQHSNHTWTLRAGQPELRIGRSPRCDIQVSDSAVSREHATLRVSPGQVSFIDHSTAGSWICVSGEPIMSLKRDTLPLTGEGVICFGSAPTGKREPARLGFSVRGVDTASVREKYSTVQLGGHIQARMLERTALTPLPVHVARADGSVEALLCDLTLDGANIRADRCLGAQAEEISLRFGAGGPTLHGVLRYASEIAPQSWNHGVKFTSLGPDARTLVQGLLYHDAEQS